MRDEVVPHRPPGQIELVLPVHYLRRDRIHQVLSLAGAERGCKRAIDFTGRGVGRVLAQQG
eukprot:277343-Lingulodinium_polyedra.AAC.1